MPDPVNVLMAVLCAALASAISAGGHLAEFSADREDVVAAKISPALLEGLERVHRVEARFLELGWLLPDGSFGTAAPLPDSPALALLEGAEPAHFPGLAAFRFGPVDGPPGVPIEHMLESGLADAGTRAARFLMARRPGLTPGDLLRAFDEEVLFGEPLLPNPSRGDSSSEASAEGRLVPLSNASLGYLLFGFLQLDPFWESHPHARREFISELLERGSRSAPMARAVRRALHPPLPRHPRRTAMGFAFSGEGGPVGFAADDETRLKEWLATWESARRELRTVPPESRAGEPHEADARSTNQPTLAELDQLIDWAAELLLWVRRELHPEGFSETLRRADSFAERARYWSSLAQSVPFASLRQAMLEELTLIAVDGDGWPENERIAHLQALGEAEELEAEQTLELDRLRAERDRQRRRMIEHLARLLAQTGAFGDFATAASTLARDFPSHLADSHAGRGLQGLLFPAWLELAHVPHPDSLWVLHQHLHDPAGRLPENAAMDLLRMASRHRLPGYERVLEDALAHGGVLERGSVLLNSEWLPPARYASELDRLARVSGDSQAPLGQRTIARDMALISAANRPDESARALLRSTLAEGLWADPQSHWSWARGEPNLLERLLGLLDREERRHYVRLGLLPEHLAGP